MVFLQVGAFPILICSMLCFAIFDTKNDYECLKSEKGKEKKKKSDCSIFFSTFLFIHHYRKKLMH